MLPLLLDELSFLLLFFTQRLARLATRRLILSRGSRPVPEKRSDGRFLAAFFDIVPSSFTDSPDVEVFSFFRRSSFFFAFLSFFDSFLSFFFLSTSSTGVPPPLPTFGTRPSPRARSA